MLFISSLLTLLMIAFVACCSVGLFIILGSIWKPITHLFGGDHEGWILLICFVLFWGVFVFLYIGAVTFEPNLVHLPVGL